MKKVVILLAICVGLLYLAACNHTFADITITSTVESTLCTSTLPDKVAEISQLPMFAITLPIVTETEYAQDGKLLFKHTYQNIALNILL